MNRQSLVRATLWFSAPFNLIVAFALAWPTSLPGRLIALPAHVPPLYAALCALFVALFGLAYAWMASRAQIERTLLGFAAIGKSSVFVLALLLWLAHACSGRIVAAASADLVLAAAWTRWLLTTRTGRS